MKKLLSLLIVLAMVLTMAPAAVFALPDPWDEYLVNASAASELVNVTFEEQSLTSFKNNQVVIGASNTTIKVTAKDKAVSFYGDISYEPMGSATKTCVAQSKMLGSQTLEASTAATLAFSSETSYGHYTIDLTVGVNSGSDIDEEWYIYEFDYAPSGTVAVLRYDNPNFSEEDERLTISGYYASLSSAIDDANIYNGELLITAQPEDWNECDVITGDINFNANGFEIGSENYPLQVNSFIYFYNLAGTFYVKLMDYYECLVSIVKPETGEGLDNVVVSLGQAPQAFRNGVLFYFDDYNGKNLPSVSVNAPGYAAVANDYDGIELVKTTDYPYAVLNSEKEFDFYGNLTEAFTAAVEGGPVYLLHYIRVDADGSCIEDVSSYSYVGQISEDQAQRLKTMIRVTDGKTSDFYIYKDSAWKCLYSNAAEGSSLISVKDGIKGLVTLKVASKVDYRYDPNDGVIVTKGWSTIERTDSDEDEVVFTVGESGSYFVDKNVSKLTLDASKYNGIDQLSITILSNNETLDLSVLGDLKINTDGSMKSKVEFSLLGKFKELYLKNADVKLAANPDYTEVTTVGRLIADSSLIDSTNDGLEKLLAISFMDLKGKTEAFFDNTLIKPLETYKNHDSDAVIVDIHALAIFNDSSFDISGEIFPAEISAIETKGYTCLINTDISIRNVCKDAFVYGIENCGTGYLIIDNTKDAKIYLEKGIAINANAEKNNVVLYGCNIEVGGANPSPKEGVPGDAIGLHLYGGSAYIRPGFYYDSAKDDCSPVNILVHDPNGYGIKLENGTHGLPVKWTITGAKNAVNVFANTAIYAESAIPYKSDMPACITTGRYFGKLDVHDENGYDILKETLPDSGNSNFYFKPIAQGVEVVNEEYELFKYLTSDKKWDEPFTLHANINYGWGDSNNLTTDYANAHGPIDVQGSKAVNLNGYYIDSSGRTYYEAFLVLGDGASLWLYSSAKDPAGSGNRIINTNGETIVAVYEGGKFANGSFDDAVYGVTLASKYTYEGSDELSITLLQSGGEVNLFGGCIQGMTVNSAGTMNIYGGEYHGITELFLGSDEGKINLCGGTIYPYYSLINDKDNTLISQLNWTMLFEAFDEPKETRTIQPGKGAQGSMMAKGTKLVPVGGTLDINDASSNIQNEIVMNIPADSSDGSVYAKVEGYVRPTPDSGGSGKVKKDEPKEETSLLDQYLDLDSLAWYAGGVEFCLEQGLMNGVSSSIFDPNGTTSRAMMMTILARMDGCDTEGGEEWYSIGMSWAKTNGISDGSDPAGFITREQFATMLYRYAKMNGRNVDKDTENVNTLSYNDIFDVSSWANEGVNWCLATGIIKGKTINGVEGFVDPQGLLTRAEAATMIQRFCEL